MKTKLQIIGIALSGLLFASCSSSMYMSKSSVNTTDDIYYTPTKTSSVVVSTEPSNSLDLLSQDPSKIEFSQLEKKYSKVLASDSIQTDTLVNKIENTNPYQDILVDSYQESYERRLKGKCSASYGMSNLSIYYSDAYFYAKAYDPSFYNVVIVGDQVWVEPWYISNMFFERSNNFRFGFGISLWNDPDFYDYYNPWLLLDPHWYGYPYGYWNGYPYAYNGNNTYTFNNYYYGRRTDNNTNLTSIKRGTGISYESEIISARKRNELTANNGINRNFNTITRNNRTDITSRNGQTNNNQEVISRGTRNENLNTTRLRDAANTRNTNLTEPTRRNNNNTYQRPRSTNNDSYIRTGTRNQNVTNGSTNRDNNTRNTTTSRDNRNSTNTYNRPSRVDSSTDRGRSSNSNANTRESSSRGSTNDRSRTSSASSSGTSSSSSSTSSSSSQQSSSSGSGERRR